MESLCPPAGVIASTRLSFKPPKTQSQAPTPNLRFPFSPTHNNPFNFPSFSFTSYTCFSIQTSCAASTSATASASTSLPSSSASSDNRHWVVLMEAPPQGAISRQQVIEYYVETLRTVLGKWVCRNLFPLFLYCLEFSLSCGLMLIFSVRRMLKCVYMMRLGIPISGFVVILTKKLPASSHVSSILFYFMCY